MILNIYEIKNTFSSELLGDGACDEERMLDEFSGLNQGLVPVFKLQRKAEASLERTGRALMTGVGVGAGIEIKGK